MECASCGFDNPVNTLYCKGCGAKMDLSPEQVRAAVQKELAYERSKAIENACRVILCFSAGILFALILVKNRNEVLPDPDLVSFVKMQALVIPNSSLIYFEEEAKIKPMPSLDQAPVLPLPPQDIKKKEADLRQRLYSENSVLLFRKGAPNPINCFIYGEDEKNYYVIDIKAKGKFPIPKSEVIEIRRKEDGPAPTPKEK